MKTAVFKASDLVRAFGRHHRCPECLVDNVTGDPVSHSPKCPDCNVFCVAVNCDESTCKECSNLN